MEIDSSISIVLIGLGIAPPGQGRRPPPPACAAERYGRARPTRACAGRSCTRHDRHRRAAPPMRAGAQLADIAISRLAHRSAAATARPAIDDQALAPVAHAQQGAAAWNMVGAVPRPCWSPALAWLGLNMRFGKPSRPRQGSAMAVVRSPAQTSCVGPARMTDLPEPRRWALAAAILHHRPAGCARSRCALEAEPIARRTPRRRPGEPSMGGRATWREQRRRGGSSWTPAPGRQSSDRPGCDVDLLADSRAMHARRFIAARWPVRQLAKLRDMQLCPVSPVAASIVVGQPGTPRRGRAARHSQFCAGRAGETAGLWNTFPEPQGRDTGRVRALARALRRRRGKRCGISSPRDARTLLRP